MNNKRFYWIKLKTDFFNQDTIDFILQQENGCKYIVLYQMLCLRTANNNGELKTTIGEMMIPYDVEKIQRDTKYFDIDTVRVALELFKKLGLIYQQEDNVLKISNFDDMVGSETKWAEKKRKQRQNNIPLKNCRRLNSEMLRLPNGNTVFVDEKRYGGNGMLAYDLAGGKCERCGSEENLCIHHNNGYSNNIEDLFILCRKCHSEVESNKEVEIVHHNVLEEIEYRDKSIEIDKDIDIDKRISTTTIYDYIEKNFGRTLSPIEYEEISNWEDNELTRYAIKQAVLNGKYNIKYISRILDNYKTKNIKSIQQAQEDEEKFKRKKEDSKKTSREKMDEVFERFLNEED